MNFGIKTIILGSVLLLLMVSIVLQGYTMYSISNAKKYEIDATSRAVTTEGVQAVKFWESYRTFFVGPTVINLIGMALMATLYVMV